jgi:hypothetical protein
MAITLNPPVSDLGIMAPVLGPWFSTAVTLDTVDPTHKLALPVTFGSATDWYAPASGLFSVYVTSGANPPAALDALQDSDGAWPFPDGRIVGFFRLLPEVEARLHELMGLVPAATASPVTSVPTTLAAPTRPQVRSFAMVLPSTVAATPAGVFPLFGGGGSLPGSSDAEHATAIGLALTSGNLTNGAVPMTRLRRPGGAVSDRDKLFEGLTGTVDLWAFDRRGRAVDPGAVACWWSWLLNTAAGDDPATGTVDFQLLAPDITATDYPQANSLPIVVSTTAQRTVHLVNVHEGPLGDPFVGDRLQSGGSAAASTLIQVTATNDVSLSFSTVPAPTTTPPPDNPTVDSAPRARMAVLPTGDYATTAHVWPGGPVHAGLDRDFVRVAVVDEEAHLVGVTRRDSRATVSTPDDRRRSAQNRPSTRTTVSRTSTTTGVLLANGQLAADALLAVPNTATPSRLVLGRADCAWGGTPATPVPAAGTPALPGALTDSGADTAPDQGQYRVQALVGGGSDAGAVQTVMVEVNLGAANAGAWVRAWPLGFDLATGLHFRLSGGAGRADTAGVARLVMALIPGKVDAAGLMGMDLLVVLTDSTGAVAARRSYADARFTRPAAATGSAPTTVSGTWLVCETGASGTGALPAGAVPPGGHVILTATSPAIVDRTAVPATAWDANTLRNRLQAADLVSLTSPAFGSTPDRADVAGHPLARDPGIGGDPRGGLDGIVGNRLHRLDRSVLSSATASSVPYALLDRLEVAAATNDSTAASAALGSIAPVPWALEPGTTQFLGHPQVPAGIETHGTGVSLVGAPAVAVAEYVRERTAGLSFPAVQGLTDPARSAAVQSEVALAAEAATALPTIADGTGAGPVVAVLRTSAFGMEGVPGVAVAATSAGTFPLGEHESDLVSWLDDQVSVAGGAGTALRSAVSGPNDSIVRALDRRILTAAFGARETLTALLAAIDRAQDFVYLETPAVDTLTIESGGENVQWWQKLVNRMSTRKGLRVVLCVPTLLLPGTPKKLQEVRDQCLMDAVDAIRAVATDRFALFSPGAGAGRAVRLASTTVVVDDAFALTGTTHLSRRGLSWDSSLAASVFDERVVDGRPSDVRSFRIQLMADRLGTPATRLPEDPAELVKAIRDLDTRGSERLSVTAIDRPSPTIPNGDVDIWNPDGSATDLTLTSMATTFAAALALTDVDHAIVEG